MFLAGVDSRRSNEPDPKTGSRSVSLAKQEGAYDFEDTQRSENRSEFVVCPVTSTITVNQTKVEEPTSGGDKPVSSFAGQVMRRFGDISRFTSSLDIESRKSLRKNEDFHVPGVRLPSTFDSAVISISAKKRDICIAVIHGPAEIIGSLT